MLEADIVESPMLRAVLWDNDGILVDTEKLFFDVNQDVCVAHGFELTKRSFFDWFLADNRGAWHLFRQRGYSEDYIREVRRRRNVRFGELIVAHERLAIEGIGAVLESLAPRLPMALVTSSSREHFELAHRTTGFLRHFSVVVTEEDCTATKPSPEPYLIATRRLGVAPADCVAVEDSPRGLAAARAAGIKCIVMRSELTAHYHFAAAQAVVDDSSALLAAIERMMEKHHS